MPELVYFALILTIFLLFSLWVVISQLRQGGGARYKSYFDDKSGAVKKKLIKPSFREIATAFIAGWAYLPRLCGALLLAALCYAGYLLLFRNPNLAALPPLLFGTDAAGQLDRGNIWLAAASLAVLLLSIIIVSQNQAIKRDTRVQRRQNLIINAHSSVTPGKLVLNFNNMDHVFLNSDRSEYILSAKPPDAAKRPGARAFLNPRLTIKLNNDYAVTEFYIKQLSLLAGDWAIECDNYYNRFFPIFAVDNEFVLNFFLKFQDTDQQQLYQQARGGLKLYYNIVIKNSFGVITEIFGSGDYSPPQTNGEELHYSLREGRSNQYFYM